MHRHTTTFARLLAVIAALSVGAMTAMAVAATAGPSLSTGA